MKLPFLVKKAHCTYCAHYTHQVPPFSLAKMVQAGSQNLKLDSEVARLRFNLAVLGLLRLLVARGVYEHGYVAQLEQGSSKVRLALTRPDSVHGERGVCAVTPKVSRAFAAPSPLHCRYIAVTLP